MSSCYSLAVYILLGEYKFSKISQTFQKNKRRRHAEAEIVFVENRKKAMVQSPFPCVSSSKKTFILFFSEEKRA